MNGRVGQVTRRRIARPRGTPRHLFVESDDVPAISPGRVRALLRGYPRRPLLRRLVPRRHPHIPPRDALEPRALLPPPLVDVARVLQLWRHPPLTPLGAFLPSTLVPLGVPTDVPEGANLRAREPVAIVLKVSPFLPPARRGGVNVPRADGRLTLRTGDWVVGSRGSVRPPRAPLPQSLVPHAVPPPTLVDAPVHPKVRAAFPVIAADVLRVVSVIDEFLRVEVRRVPPPGAILPSPRVPREPVIRVPHLERHPHVAIAAVAVERAVLVPPRVNIRVDARGDPTLRSVLPSTRVGARRREGAGALRGDGGVEGVHASRHVLRGSAEVVLVSTPGRSDPRGVVVCVFRGGTVRLVCRGAVIADDGIRRGRGPDAVGGLLGAVAVRAPILPSALVQTGFRRVR